MTKQKHFFLSRGLIREVRHWAEFPTLLQNAFPGSKVTMIDIPGAGVHNKLSSPLSMRRIVEHMRRSYLEVKKENDECILVAISLGGMIAGQWMKDYPQDFSKAILMNTSYGGISGVFDRFQLSALAQLIKVPLLKGRAKEAHILRVVLNHNNVFDKTLDLWEKIQKDRPVSLGNTIRQIAAGGLFRIGSFKPEIPVLLLAGAQDRMVKVECSRAIAEKWQAPLIEHPTAGHSLSDDAPEWIVDQIKSFLA